ncbi:MAG: sugar phosphate isomerase/epimerase [Caulobacteraceae bacterium]|nr:sugar phosphate isomerase/epimerase [Caulobacteraceae bacterium]
MKFGLQLYTLRRAFRDDPVATLERVRALGYDEVEFAAPLDMDFAALRRRMDAIGLACPSAHVGLDDLRQRPAEVLRMGERLGCRYLVMPYLTPEQRQWDEVIGSLDGLARTVTSAGFGFAYHNHDFEFEGLAGQRPYDRLLAGTDPALVGLELDLYWTRKAGEDPDQMLARLNGRVKLVHLKDMADDGDMADVGAGVMDYGALLKAAKAAGAEHFIVEHDRPADPWASVEASLTHLRALTATA